MFSKNKEQEVAARRYPLIAPGEPPPYELFNTDGQTPAVVVCDHAGREIPAAMHQLGLDDWVLDEHVAWDIGSASVGRILAKRLDSPAVLANYSRLLVDPNRRLDDPSAFIRVSDGIAVPGNLNITDEDKQLRKESFFDPYHAAIDAQLKRIETRGETPALLSIHSCTPVFNRIVRPWHIGILWDQDPRIAVPLLRSLSRIDGLCVGDNQPYSGRHPHDFTVDHHAEPYGRPHVGIEVRQDLISDAAGAREWAEILASAFTEILADEALYQPLHAQAAPPAPSRPNRSQ